MAPLSAYLQSQGNHRAMPTFYSLTYSSRITWRTFSTTSGGTVSML